MPQRIKPFITSLILIILLSCNNKINIKNLSSQNDTLYIMENSFTNRKSGDSYIEKEYSYKGKYLPKSKNIILTFTYLKPAKHILDNSKIILSNQHKDIIINKLKKNKFNIYIKNNYKDSIFTFDFKIIPKKNYKYKIVNQNFSKTIDTMLIARHLKYVEQ